jgi:FSR family fosmidomycin resistance protein-like MFS transporter
MASPSHSFIDMINKTNNRHTLPLAWGLLHGINDWVAGYMVISYSLHHPIQYTSIALLIYTILGFGGQLPVGMWIDQRNNLSPFVTTSLLLLVASIPVFWLHDLSGIIIAGCSSAFLHVTGGSICLQNANEKSTPLGLFTAPGVLGLTLGIASGNLSMWWLAAAIAGVIVVISLFKTRSAIQQATPRIHGGEAHALVEGHDWIMIAILLAATLRSFLYEVINLFSHNWQYGLLVIGISAFAGKLIGGFLADKIGWRRWVYITLPLAFLLLQFGRDNIFALGFGIACLQSSVPVSLLLMQKSMPGMPASATAMTLGIAIALSGSILFVIDRVPVQKQWFTNTGFIAGVVLLVMILWLVGRRRVNFIRE